MLGLFGALSFHALKHEPEIPFPAEGKAEAPDEEACRTAKRWPATVRVLGEVIVALGLALGAVVIMVEAGQTIATDEEVVQIRA